MSNKILDYWSLTSLITSLLAFYTFINIFLYGYVLYGKPSAPMLMGDLFLSGVILIISIYVVYQVLFKNKTVKLEKEPSIQRKV